MRSLKKRNQNLFKTARQWIQRISLKAKKLVTQSLKELGLTAPKTRTALLSSYREKKKSAKVKMPAVLHYGTLWQFSERAQITFCAVAEGNLLPFGLLCMRNPRIACNADHVLPFR